jgi:hypothetical protein
MFGMPEHALAAEQRYQHAGRAGRSALLASRFDLYFLKVAVTLISAVVRVTTQVPVPWHPPPLQPVNRYPAAAVAVRVTWVPLLYAALQVGRQLIPAGLLVTVPCPCTATVSLRAWLGLVTEERCPYW